MSFTSDLSSFSKHATAEASDLQQHWSAPVMASKQIADVYEGIGFQYNDYAVNSFFEPTFNKGSAPQQSSNSNTVTNNPSNKLPAKNGSSSISAKKKKPISKRIGIPEHVTHKTDRVVDAFLNRFESVRMKPVEDKYEEVGKFKIRKKITSMVLQQVPIQMVLPAFPCKSPNAVKKVLGVLPDGGEELALKRLGQFCEDISAIYQPGCHLVIFSDGRVFSDLVGVNDKLVSEYGEELRRMNTCKYITFDTLDNYMGYPDDHVKTREELMKHGVTPEQLDVMIHSEQETLNVYRAFSKFLTQDRVWPEDMSKKQISKQCGQIAREMMRRNIAFSKLVEEKYPQALRLSIHAHPNVGPKFGVALSGSQSRAATPWHNVLVEFANGTVDLLHREELQNLPGKFELIEKNGRAWCFREVQQ